MENNNLEIFSEMCSSLHTLRGLVETALERCTQPYGIFAITSVTTYARKTFETYNQFPGIDTNGLSHALIQFRKELINSKSITDLLIAYDNGYKQKLQVLKDNPGCKFPVTDFACRMQCIANEVIHQMITLRDMVNENRKEARKMVERMRSQKGTVTTGA